MTIHKTFARFIFLSVSVYTLIFAGCNNKYKVEISMIDSLISKNRKAAEYINIDLITINQRRKELKAQIAVLSSYKVDSSLYEFETNFIKYEAIYKSYKKFIENYDIVHSRIKQNEKQLSALKNSLIDEKINGTDFKTALNRETLNVNDNLTNAEILGNTIFKLEPDYQRLSEYFDPLVEKIIAGSAELKKVFEENSEK